MAVQPILDLRTGRLAGYEALARFPGGRRPDLCFAQAYAHGLGPQLEARAVEAALNLKGRPAHAYLSFNLSATALVSAEVQAVLPEDLSGLVIEITEHEPIREDARIRAALDDLRARGARIAVDDAGSGYAGLKQIAQINPDVVKLDRTLVCDVDVDPVKAALIESFVRFARDLGAVVCAEGIEREGELARLAELDVGYGQGYVLARPGRPYPAVDADAAEVCAASLNATLVTLPERLTEDANDRRLEALSARLSATYSYAGLEDSMGAIAEELHADEVVLSALDGDELVTIGRAGPHDRPEERYSIDAYPATLTVLARREVVQLLASDPAADPREVALLRELGFTSLLMLPVMCSGRVIGLLEVYARHERPWTRFEIRRGRIISYGLGAVLDRVQRDAR
jgi:EAL domain-containing protein (putative c-di-GMP-specific phosphodiesterase class I)